MGEQDHSGRRNPLTRMMVDTFDNLMRQCMFCLPGRIMAFDPETQLAQVECGIQRIRDGKGYTIPVIQSVPVCFAGDGDWHFFHQITPGETEGLIHFSQRAIDTWIDQGGPVAPHEARMLTEDDAFFVPGVRSRPGAIPNFRNDGAGISNAAQDVFAHLKADGTIEVQSTGDMTINGARITPDGDVITAAGVSLDNHYHTQPSDAAGDSESPTDAPTATE